MLDANDIDFAMVVTKPVTDTPVADAQPKLVAPDEPLHVALARRPRTYRPP